MNHKHMFRIFYRSVRFMDSYFFKCETCHHIAFLDVKEFWG